MSHAGHDMSIDDSSSADGSSSAAMLHLLMKPYLHFSGGDVFLFEKIIPRSGGTVFAACLVTFILAVISRYVASVSRGLQIKFIVRSASLLGNDEKSMEAPSRFILSHELARSTVVGIEVFLHYTLMLIAMTFHAGYIICIILGAVAGELAFGRLHRRI